MSLVVQKYGGTSVASADRIGSVADRIARARAAGHRVAVVVSAMAGETDRLLGLAAAVRSPPRGRELDTLLASGEQASTGLVAMALEARGCPARSYSGAQIPIRTDSSFNRARNPGDRPDPAPGRSRRGAGGRRRRVPGGRRGGQRHHSRAGRLGHDGGGARGRPRGGRMPDLHRRGRGVYRRPPGRAPMPGGWTASRSRRCSSSRASARRCSRSGRWSSQASTGCRFGCCPRSTTARGR